MGDTQFVPRLEQCLIAFRDDSDGPIFYFHGDHIDANLFRYVVVPIEDYEKHVDSVREMCERLEPGDQNGSWMGNTLRSD